MSSKIKRISLVSYLIPALLKLDAFNYILRADPIGPFGELPVVARSAVQYVTAKRLIHCAADR